MPTVEFAKNFQRHVATEPCDVDGVTVGQALDAVFTRYPKLRSYILDDQSRVRKHIAVFVDQQNILDRDRLTDPVTPESQIYVVQALSGG